MSPVRRQAITWTNAGFLSIGILETNYSEIWIGILPFPSKKIHLEKSSAKMMAILSRGRWGNMKCNSSQWYSEGLSPFTPSLMVFWTFLFTLQWLDIKSRMAWASYQIRKIAGCACAGNVGIVFPRHRLQRKPLVSDPGMHPDTCVTHVPWYQLVGIANPRWRGNFPGIPGACATRSFTYLARGPW